MSTENGTWRYGATVEFDGLTDILHVTVDAVMTDDGGYLADLVDVERHTITMNGQPTEALSVAALLLPHLEWGDAVADHDHDAFQWRWHLTDVSECTEIPTEGVAA